MLLASTVHEFSLSAKLRLQRDEILQVVVVERIGLAEIAAGIELVEPDLPRRRALLEEQHHGLHARALERAAGQSSTVCRLQLSSSSLRSATEALSVFDRNVFLMTMPARPPAFSDLDEMLQEQERGLAGLDREILLHLRPLLAAERRIGQHHVEAVLLLDVGDVLGQRVGVDDVRRLDAVQDHVHDADDVGEALLLLAVEGLLLERLEVLGRELAGLACR